MTHPDPTLAEHAERLLTGTGITPGDAPAVAAGHRPGPGAAAAALRDGWAAAAAAAAPPTGARPGS